MKCVERMSERRYGGNYNACCSSYGNHRDNCKRFDTLDNIKKMKGDSEYQVLGGKMKFDSFGTCLDCGKRVGSLEVHDPEICTRYKLENKAEKTAIQELAELGAETFNGKTRCGNMYANNDTDEQLVNHVLGVLSLNRGILDFVDKKVDDLKMSEYKALVAVCKKLTNYQEPKKYVIRGSE